MSAFMIANIFSVINIKYKDTYILVFKRPLINDVYCNEWLLALPAGRGHPNVLTYERGTSSERYLILANLGDTESFIRLAQGGITKGEVVFATHTSRKGQTQSLEPVRLSPGEGMVIRVK